jgi:hypothetical protein
LFHWLQPSRPPLSLILTHTLECTQKFINYNYTRSLQDSLLPRSILDRFPHRPIILSPFWTQTPLIKDIPFHH